MDIAQIAIEKNDYDKWDAKYTLTCNMPNFNTQIFTIYKPNEKWFLQYGDLPIVCMSVGADLYKGLSAEECPYQILILPKNNASDQLLEEDNITDFYIGMQTR